MSAHLTYADISSEFFILGYIPVVLLYLELLLGKMLREKLRKGYRPVLSACTAERDNKLALALADIERDKVVDEVGYLLIELLRFLKAHNIIADAALGSGMVPELLYVIWIRQASDVEHEVGFGRYSILEAERHHLYNK